MFTEFVLLSKNLSSITILRCKSFFLCLTINTKKLLLDRICDSIEKIFGLLNFFMTSRLFEHQTYFFSVSKRKSVVQKNRNETFLQQNNFIVGRFTYDVM